MDHAAAWAADLVTTQRVALVVYHLGVLGQKLTTQEVATLVGLKYHGALAMLDKISCARTSGGGIPLVNMEGRWMILPRG